MRSSIASLLLVVVACLSFQAKAQTFTFTPYEGGEDSSNDLSDVELEQFFNMARCLCDQDSTGPYYSFRVDITSSGPYTGRIYFLLGDDCFDSERHDECFEFDDIEHSNLRSREYKLYMPMNRIVDPEEGTCEQVQGTSTLYLFTEEDRTAAVASYPINFDTRPPGAPELTSVVGGERALTVKWNRPSENDEDIAFYNVLCEVGGRAADICSASDAQWTLTQDVCGKELFLDSNVTPVDGGLVDGGITDAGAEASVADADTDAQQPDAALPDAALPDAQAVDGWATDSSVSSDCVGTLNEGDWPRACFVCGSTGSSATEYRVKGLPNGVEVRVAVVAVDTARNVSQLSNTMTGTPVPTTDFAEYYRDSGGKGTGGFCFVATVAYGSYEHGHVKVLRRFRDQVLSQSGLGRAFVSFYYRNGRAWADAFQDRPAARILLRAALAPMVAFAWIWVETDGLGPGLLLLLLAGALIMFRRRRRKAKARGGA